VLDTLAAVAPNLYIDSLRKLFRCWQARCDQPAATAIHAPGCRSQCQRLPVC